MRGPVALVSALRLTSPRIAPRHFAPSAPPRPHPPAPYRRQNASRRALPRVPRVPPASPSSGFASLRLTSPRLASLRLALISPASHHPALLRFASSRFASLRIPMPRFVPVCRVSFLFPEFLLRGECRVAGDRWRLGKYPSSIRRVMIKSSKRGSLGPSELVSRETYDSSSPSRRPGTGEERGERGEDCGARGERSGERGEGRGEGRGERGVGEGRGERGMERDEGGTARGRVADCSSLAALRLASLAQGPWASPTPGPLDTHPPVFHVKRVCSRGGEHWACATPISQEPAGSSSSEYPSTATGGQSSRTAKVRHAPSRSHVDRSRLRL